MTRAGIRPVALALLVVRAIALPGSALGSATPVGPLPAGPTVRVESRVGELVTGRLPRLAAAGYVWRLARAYDATRIEQVGERGDAATGVVLRYRALGAGTVRLAFAVTRGDAGRVAVRARFVRVRIRA